MSRIKSTQRVIVTKNITCLCLALLFFSTALFSAAEDPSIRANVLYKQGLYSQAFYVARAGLKKYPGDKRLINIAETSYNMEQQRLLRELEFAKQMQRVDTEVYIEKNMLAPHRSVTLIEDAGNRQWIKTNKAEQVLDQRLSLNLTGADLNYVLGLLFRTTGVNLIADEDLLEGKRMSIHVEDVPVRDILGYMTRTLGISYSAQGQSIWITAAENPILQERVYSLQYGLTSMGKFALTSGGGSGGGGGGQATATVQGGGIAEGESDSEKLLQWMEKWPAWPQGSVWRIDQRNNRLYMLTTPEMHKRLAPLLALHDQEPIQVSIQARFVDMGINDSEELGVEWHTTGTTLDKSGDRVSVNTDPALPTGFGDAVSAVSNLNVALQGVISSHRFNAVMSMIQKNKDTNVLSSPQILTLNNEAASIAITDEFDFPTNYEPISATTTGTNTTTSDVVGLVPTDFETIDDVGITLNVLPSVGRDRSKILLTLNPKIKSFRTFSEHNVVITNAGQTQTQTISRPLFSNRNVSSKAFVNSGDTVVLGGLMSKTEETSVTKVPFLGDIPLLGRLFRQNKKLDSKQNLMIFVTAKIIEPSGDEKISNTAKEDPFRVPSQSAIIARPPLEIKINEGTSQARKVLPVLPGKKAVTPVISPAGTSSEKEIKSANPTSVIKKPLKITTQKKAKKSAHVGNPRSRR